MMQSLRSILGFLGIAPREPITYASNVTDFISALKLVAADAGQGYYAFNSSEGRRQGFVQFIIQSDRKLSIHRIWADEPKKGNGTAILQLLCDFADRHAVELTLKALPFGRKPFPMSREQLKVWYQRYGFKGARWKMSRAPLAPGCQTNADHPRDNQFV
jgi:hypothetical protein